MDKPNIVYQDINFLENPLWVTDLRDKRNEFEVRVGNGSFLYKAQKDNIPNDMDAVFLYYFLLAAQQTGQRKLKITRYKVLKDLNYSTSKRSYERFETALRRWQEVSVRFVGSFYTVKKNKNPGKEPEKIVRYLEKGFHILNYKIVKDKKAKNKSGREIGEYEVTFDPDFFETMQESLSKRGIDLTAFVALQKPLARRLYEWLPKQFIRRSVYEIGAEKFFRKMRMSEKVYPSTINKRLASINSNLKRLNSLDGGFEYSVELIEKRKKDYFFKFIQHKKAPIKAPEQQSLFPDMEAAKQPKDNDVRKNPHYEKLVKRFGVPSLKAEEIILNIENPAVIDYILERVERKFKAGEIKQDIGRYTAACFNPDRIGNIPSIVTERKESIKRKREQDEARQLQWEEEKQKRIDNANAIDEYLANISEPELKSLQKEAREELEKVYKNKIPYSDSHFSQGEAKSKIEELKKSAPNELKKLQNKAENTVIGEYESAGKTPPVNISDNIHVQVYLMQFVIEKYKLKSKKEIQHEEKLIAGIDKKVRSIVWEKLDL